MICFGEMKKGRPSKTACLLYFGVPTGSRTPVTGVKGPCPRPLDDGDIVNLQFKQVAPYIFLNPESQAVASIIFKPLFSKDIVPPPEGNAPGAGVAAGKTL